MEQVNQSLERYRSGIVNDFQQLMHLIQNCFTNQQVLSKSAADNDDQFAVLLRLTISRLNMLVSLQNSIYLKSIEQLPAEQRPENPAEHLVPEVTYEDVQALFVQYDGFKQRPDFRDHFRAWYTGADLSTLPPPPAVEVKEGPLAAQGAPEAEPEAPFPEGAEFFGGDYGSANGNGAEETQAQRTETEATEQNPVPEMRQLEDSGPDPSGNHQEGPVVSEL